MITKSSSQGMDLSNPFVKPSGSGVARLHNWLGLGLALGILGSAGSLQRWAGTLPEQPGGGGATFLNALTSPWQSVGRGRVDCDARWGHELDCPAPDDVATG